MYKDTLVIVGFPANNFGRQELGTNAAIKSFCKKNYGVAFSIAAKVSVKGNDIHPLFKWLTNKNENGKLIQYFNTNIAPMSNDITQYLK